MQSVSACDWVAIFDQKATGEITKAKASKSALPVWSYKLVSLYVSQAGVV